ncbi:Resolvase domain containing protein [Clostridium sp. DL-VIII]|uniref:recombinase family protein n=1 Tax=Clostridium sp. DL-VIII TaxID=641107 RepID=UPI00023AF9A0|nr:recombinase family protein [Clostridium sp. DL-VIII]EHI98709.1 Resolvase domain containing protein [Clostridium sp. DL-VIII]
MRIYGYCRVSTKDQNLDRQLIELEKYVDDRFIFTEKQSGKDFDRPQYQLLRKVAQSGDIIYIKSLDRLGRNKQQIKQELEYFKTEGVRLKILDIPTTMMDIQQGQEWLLDMINNLLIEVLSTMAEQEKLNTKLRQAEGIAAAKEKGKHLGRPNINFPPNWLEIYTDWKDKKITAVKAMKELNLKKNTFYKLVKQHEDLIEL